MIINEFGLRLLRPAMLLLIAGCCAVSASAAPIVVSMVEQGTLVNTTPAIATSDTAPLPQPPGVYTSGSLVDEAYAYVTRTHEWTAARTDPATGLLNTAATGNLQPFPSYLVGAEYIQVANEHRIVADYSIDATLSTPVRAFLFLDNRIDGLFGDLNTTPAKSNTTDPVIDVGPLLWVTNDGWTRVNTGFMPNGQADYLGIDEGATVATALLRTHHDPGSGIALNQFMAIYTKRFEAGLNVGLTKAQNSGGIDMYGVAFIVVPEPGTLAIGMFGVCAAMITLRRRSRD